MAMLPKLKLKALVSFPANVIGGTGIGITKTSGNFTVGLDYSEFAFQGSLPTGSNVLVWDPVTNVYTLIPPTATGGISDAPSDGLTYGRKNHAWVDAWASPVLTGNPTSVTPAPGDSDTSIATTAFVGTAIAAIPAGTPPPAPATATPIANGVGAVGVSLKYAREDHVHPAGAAGSGDVTGPAGAAADNIATYNGTTGKIIKDSGSKVSDLAALTQVVRYDTAQSLTSAQQKQARANIAVNDGNVVINGDFRINQGGYVSGAVLTPPAYGHDQWKAGASGGDYSFTQLKSSTQITIAAGKSLIQPIEDVNVVGGSYVLSWSGTAQARAGVNTLAPSGAYAASPLLIAGQTAGTVMSVEFNAGTLGTVKLESGSLATPFVMRPHDHELLTCKRYYWKPVFASVQHLAVMQAYSTIGAVGSLFPLPVGMRSAPAINGSAANTFSLQPPGGGNVACNATNITATSQHVFTTGVGITIPSASIVAGNATAFFANTAGAFFTFDARL